MANFADLDGDGDKDLLSAANTTTNTWSYYENTSPPVSVDTSVSTLTAASAQLQHQVVSAGSAALGLRVIAKNAGASTISNRSVSYTILHEPTGAAAFLNSSVATTSSSGTAAVTLTTGAKNGIYVITAVLDTGMETFVVYTNKVDLAANKWELRAFSGMDTSGTKTTTSELDDNLGAQEKTGLGDLTSGKYRLYAWDPLASSGTFSKYKIDSTSVYVGKGYWIKSFSAASVDISGTAPAETFSMRVEAGWNLIANPFWHYIDYDSDIRFETYPGNRVTPSAAYSAGVLSENALFWYDHTAGSYKWGPNLTTGGASTVSKLQLRPWLGVWTKVSAGCTMWFYPNPRIPTTSAVITANQASAYSPPLKAAGTIGDWVVQITASSGAYMDDMNYIGVRPTAAEVGAPPGQLGGMTVTVKRYGDTANYAQRILASVDIGGMRAPTVGEWPHEAVWEIRVTAPKTAGDVTLAVNNVSGVPAKVPLRLRDMATGREQNLRASSTYTYGASAGENRAFQLSAAPAGFPALDGVIYPQVCVISRTIPWFASPARTFRDALLRFSIGRKFCMGYYEN